MKGDVFDLRRLRYFSAIAASGSLSSAARILNIAQPALTHHVGELEKRLGKPVFLRTSRGVELTAAGKVLLEHAEKILQDVAAAEAALKALDGVRVVPSAVRMCLTPSVYDVTSALVAEFSTAFPETRLTVSEDRHRYCYELIENGKRELALTLQDPNWPGGRSVCWEDMHLVSLPTGRADEDGPVAFRRLADEPRLIVPGVGGPLRTMIDEIAAETGTTLSIAQELQGASARKYAVLDGLGSAIIPSRNVAREAKAGVLRSRRIVDPPMRRELVLRQGRGVHPDFLERCAAMMRRLLTCDASVSAKP